MLLLALASVGCELGPLPFTCTTDADCVDADRAGRCEPTGTCSFEDSACVAGYRYGEHSQEALRSRCTNCVADVVLGARHGCVLTTDGRVACWGADDLGQLGGGGEVVTDAVAVAAGEAHTCAILADSGKVRCWGNNQQGQCGTDATTTSTPPIDVFARASNPLENALLLDLGSHHTCARAGPAATCWGDDRAGQLGRDCSTANQCHEAAGVELPVTAEPSHVATGGASTCMRVDGANYCWGDNTSGQLALTGTTFQTPTLSLPLADVDGPIAIGNQAACGVAGDEVKCWGTLGAEPTPPLPIATIRNPTDLAVGSGHACALMDGEVFCWGNESVGHVADAPPTRVALGSAALAIAAAGDVSCALTAESVVRCWGRGDLLDASGGESVAPQTVFDGSVLCQ